MVRTLHLFLQDTLFVESLNLPSKVEGSPESRWLFQASSFVSVRLFLRGHVWLFEFLGAMDCSTNVFHVWGPRALVGVSMLVTPFCIFGRFLREAQK